MYILVLQSLVECEPDSFKCDDGLCMAGHVRCNGLENCYDGSDEESCSEYGFCVDLLDKIEAD